MKIGNRTYTNNHTYVMGILNVTPDSFSDGGKWNNPDMALKHTEQMLKDGADIIDVGGESTRPGYTMISDDEEIERVLPVIEAIKNNFDIPVSLDTYKSKVAMAGIAAGVDLINDIWGLKYDSEMASVIADAKIPCCIMHNRKEPLYTSFVKDMISDIRDSIEIGLKAGITEDKIILDPGVGFAKTYEQNLIAIKQIDKICKLGYPVLLGTSRKSVVGLTLDLPKDERVEGTLVTSVIAAQNRCMFVRVHDVKENVRAIKMTEVIMNA